MELLCSIDDLKSKLTENQLINVTDDEGTGEVSTDRALAEITNASAEIYSYTDGRYIRPFDPVPVILRKYCVDITVYNLFQRSTGAPEHIIRDRDNAIKFLTNVAKGQAHLDLLVPEPETQDVSPQAPRIDTRVQIFGPDTLDRY